MQFLVLRAKSAAASAVEIGSAQHTVNEATLHKRYFAMELSMESIKPSERWHTGRRCIFSEVVSINEECQGWRGKQERKKTKIF